MSYQIFGAYHLSNAVKTLSMKLESLFEQNLVFDGPLVREWCKVGQVQNGSFQIVFVPKKHSQSLLPVISIFFFRQYYILIHCKKIKMKKMLIQRNLKKVKSIMKKSSIRFSDKVKEKIFKSHCDNKKIVFLFRFYRFVVYTYV